MGEFTGKIGVVVGRVWRGKKIMSSYNPRVTNPKTEKQQTNRARFGELNRLAKIFRPCIKVGFEHEAIRLQKTEVGEFNRVNFPCVTATTPEDVTVDIPSLKVSIGKFPSVEFDAMAVGANSITVSFNSTWVEQEVSEDQVYLVLYFPQAERVIVSNAVKRYQGTITETIPAELHGQQMYVYGFVKAAPTNLRYAGENSESVFIGTETV